MDLVSYSLWESHLVDWLGGPRNPDGEWAPAEVLSMLVVQAQTLAVWRPGHGTLANAIGDLARQAPARIDADARWHAAAVPINRFLAAHAFASWTAYQADGVVAQVNRLQHVLDVLRIEADRVCCRDGGGLTDARLLEAVRHTDLRLRHVVDSSSTKREGRRQARPWS
jgi:hypothetical protein